MVVRIRLQRFGRHDRPFYRIVAADSRSPRDGRFIELLGSYDPIASKDGIKEVRIKGDRVKYWLSVGAQPSDRVAWLMSKYNILPPAPLPPSTVQHLPRKERKELAEAAAKEGGGAKKYHTSAAAAESKTRAGLDAAAFVAGGAMMGSMARGSLGVSLPWARR